MHYHLIGSRYREHIGTDGLALALLILELYGLLAGMVTMVN